MALVSKILETTLTAGQTSVSFTDSDIPNSLIRVFASNTDVIPVSRTLIGNTLTVTYEAQSANMGVALEIQKQGLEIVDNLTSSDADKALSAKQGKALNDDITTLSGNLSDLAETVNNLDIPEEITDLDDVAVTSIQDGQVLAWDEDLQKFVNVNQSGGGSSIVYSTTEQLIGKWINNEDLYQKTINFGSLPNATTKFASTGFTSGSINIINMFGIATNSQYDITLSLPRASIGSGDIIDIIATQNNGYESIRINCSANYSSYNGYITIQYTKTS